MKTFFYYCFMAFAAIALSACSAEDGKDGIDGPQGEQGPPGEDGNANVIYSDWIPIEWNFEDEATDKSMLIEEENLGRNFFENGGNLLVYLKSEGGLEVEYAVVSLPYMFDNDYLSFIFFDAQSISQKGILIHAESIDGTTPLDTYDDGRFFVRYVLLPGGISLEENARLWKNMDPANYHEVADYFNIEQ